ncbi:MAG: TraR/DksA C4-type zinc finger protein [Chloroflexi bacterium]|nr:TraR/DksA C4-type zinc finger protein [Chloroflexota bacterium]
MRRRLVRMRRDLTNESTAEGRELATPASERGEDTTPSQHPADVASELEAREFVLTRRLIVARELQDVEEALVRIEMGTYGVCVDCGGPIAAERLEARPQAARDVECLRRARLGQKGR